MRLMSHYHGHVIGIKGPEFCDNLIQLDNITGYLHSKIEYHGLYDLNIVPLSDYGMVTIKLDNDTGISSDVKNLIIVNHNLEYSD